MLVLSRFDWFRDPHKVATGCHELGKCATPWWVGPFLFGYFLGPAILFAAVNAYAWCKWTVKRWTYYTIGLTVLAVVLYFLDARV
ncbi:hypothetical protein SAMN05421548_10519 [Paraburkholderia lycopersici]|uniref:Uncharacterized protein n=1 Tax=Paraburkholderia lycopersici TaxID=416944 RepID=A0A1G6JXT3_9BURK|nr:hypothetical protein SAMN05421548_10519 [Paraburkholderia lycopersici]